MTSTSWEVASTVCDIKVMLITHIDMQHAGNFSQHCLWLEQNKLQHQNATFKTLQSNRHLFKQYAEIKAYSLPLWSVSFHRYALRISYHQLFCGVEHETQSNISILGQNIVWSYVS